MTTEAKPKQSRHEYWLEQARFYSGDSPHKWINLVQSSEERQQKYWLAISCGASPAQARRMRDWRLSKIERLYADILSGKQPLDKTPRGVVD